MKKPFIFYHTLVSTNGICQGEFLDTPKGKLASDIFKDLILSDNAFYHPQAILVDSKTAQIEYAECIKKDLSYQQGFDGDYLFTSNYNKYYFVIDPNGENDWKSNVIVYHHNTLQVVEILTSKVSEKYKTYLRSLKIPYIIVGEDEINYDILMNKLTSIFNVNQVMLLGTSKLNWELIQAGYCDEVSMIMVPVLEITAHHFDNMYDLFNNPVELNLLKVVQKDKSILWLRYQIKN